MMTTFFGFCAWKVAAGCDFLQKKTKKQLSRNVFFHWLFHVFFIGVGSSSTLLSGKSSVDFCCRDCL